MAQTAFVEIMKDKISIQRLAQVKAMIELRKLLLLLLIIEKINVRVWTSLLLYVKILTV